MDHDPSLIIFRQIGCVIGFTSTSDSLGHTPYDPHADTSPECQGEALRKAARPPNLGLRRLNPNVKAMNPYAKPLSQNPKP